MSEYEQSFLAIILECGEQDVSHDPFGNSSSLLDGGELCLVPKS